MKKIKLAVFDMEGTLFRRSYCFRFIKDRFPKYWLYLCLSLLQESLTTRPFSKSWMLLCQLLGPQASKIDKESWEQWCDGGYLDKFKETLALLKKGEIKEWSPWSYLSDLLGPEASKIDKDTWEEWIKGGYLAQNGEGFASKRFTSTWTLLCDLLGPYASQENKGNWDRWSDRGYPGYSEWVIDTIKIHKRYGLTKDIFDAVVNESAEYFPGVAETLQALKSQGITIALVSGGLKAMSDLVAKEYNLEHCFTSAEYFWNPDGTISHWNCQPSDFNHKKRLVKLLLHDLGFSKEEAVFIGDGGNDRDAAQFVGLSIGFYPKPHHEFFWDVVVKHDPNSEPKPEEEKLSKVLNHIPLVSEETTPCQ